MSFSMYPTSQSTGALDSLSKNMETKLGDEALKVQFRKTGRRHGIHNSIRKAVCLTCEFEEESLQIGGTRDCTSDGHCRNCGAVIL